MKDDIVPVSKKSVKKASPGTQKPTTNRKTDFVPPEEVAQNEDKLETRQPNGAPLQAKLKLPQKKHWYNFSKKQSIIIAVVAILLVGGGVGAYFALHKKPVVVIKKEEPSPNLQNRPPSQPRSAA